MVAVDFEESLQNYCKFPWWQMLIEFQSIATFSSLYMGFLGRCAALRLSSSAKNMSAASWQLNSTIISGKAAAEFLFC